MFLKVKGSHKYRHYCHAPHLTFAISSFACPLNIEDAGFHRALKELMSSAKWPMILTSNQPPRSLRDVSCHMRHVKPTSVPQVAVLLAMIWAAEGLPAVPPSVFSWLASSSPGDIRSAIMNLQLSAANPLALMKHEQHQSLMPMVAPASSSLYSHCGQFGYLYPIVISVRPFTGRTKGGAKIVVKGVNFLQPSAGPPSHEGKPLGETWAPVQVLIGYMPCTDVVVISDTAIEARVPSSPLGNSSQFPVVVKICRLVCSQAIRQRACQTVYRYQDKQACFDELFPELKLPNQRQRLIRKDSDDDHEEEDILLDPTHGEQAVDVTLEDPSAAGEGSDSDCKKELSSKRRKVVLESDDEDEEWIEPSVQPVTPQETVRAEDDQMKHDLEEKGTPTPDLIVENMPNDIPAATSDKENKEDTNAEEGDLQSLNFGKERTYREAFRFVIIQSHDGREGMIGC